MNKCKVSQINSTAVEYSCKITSAIFSTVQKGRQQMKNYKKKKCKPFYITAAFHYKVNNVHMFYDFISSLKSFSLKGTHEHWDNEGNPKMFTLLILGRIASQ